MSRLAIDARSTDLAGVRAQIPHASTQAPQTRVVVFASAPRGWLGRMLARDGAPPHVLCSALLVRGYTNIAAGHEDGRPCAWGDA